MENILKLLAKSVLITLGLTPEASTAETGTLKNY